MLQTKRDDWIVIITVSVILVLATFVTIWDFGYVQEMNLNIVNVVIGSIFFSAGAISRWMSKRTLGKQWKSGLEILKNHELIIKGIYKHVRHPSYLGTFMLWGGFCLVLSLYGFFLTVGLIPCFLYRIKIEERMLIEKFGNEYREYMKNTKKIIPFIY